MKRIALAYCATLALTAMPVLAQETCHDVTEGVEYCTDAEQRRGFISQAIYPDLFGVFTLSDDPLISTNVVVMPLDRTLIDSNDMVDMIFEQYRRGTPHFSNVGNLQVRGSTIDGRASIQVDFMALSKDNNPRGGYIVEALPGADAVLLIYTVQERHAKEADGRPGPKVEAITDEMRAAHAAAMQDYRIGL
ncbi:hypothetical protein [uncultured Tateyamaria sp.]|uniref:hypothetical protein n=1 Tax=uncultured Tateyamaria sp. TaxID=455651 RepID=UPI00262AAF83|nr:hypothetical protein [uncultured Tateyamaria sp.]